jgi:hypothetical protein
MKVHKLIDCVAASESLEDCRMENRLQLQIRARVQLQEIFQANAQQGSCGGLRHTHMVRTGTRWKVDSKRLGVGYTMKVKAGGIQ